MKMRVMLMVAMLALSGAAYADNDHNGGVTGNCGQGLGSGNANCLPNGGNGGDGGDGGNGGAGGAANAAANATALAAANANATAIAAQQQGQIQGQAQGQLQGQVANSQGGQGGSASASGGNGFGGSATTGPVTVTSTNEVLGGAANVGNVTSGDVTSTNTNTANGGVGGQGGEAVAAATVENGAVVVNVDTGAARAAATPPVKYVEVQQAPAIGQGSFAIQGCSVAGNGGVSVPGGAGFLGFGFTPEQCYDFMIAQAYQSLGEKKAACDILRNSKAGKRQEKRGIVLPGCEPEVVVVPVPAPVVETKTVYVEVPPEKISE